MKKIFKPRARMLLQLGDQLIKTENIAVVELVKNSYDAGADNCEVFLKDIDNKNNGEIIIKDNGIGMTSKVIEEVWLEPGADFKKLILNEQLNLFDYSYTSKRIPIGEKGIGRFGVHKLGNYIEMVTKSAESKKEIVVKIDWEKFEDNKYLEDAKFDVVERNPEVFTNGKTGTYISVKKLKAEWDITKYKNLYRTINSLNSPFKNKGRDEFSVKLHLEIEDKEKQQKWTEKMLTIDEIKDSALWKLECTVSGNKIIKFRYKFMPYTQMDKLEGHTITEKDKIFESYSVLKRGKKGDILDLSKHKIGEFKLEMYVFYLGSKVLRFGVSDTTQLDKFLAENGGVRVYRDNMRIYSYGEREDDWLGLDQQRITNLGGRIGNKLILGAISLERELSVDLEEKTNREGFLENEAYADFKESILYTIGIFNNFRNLDKAKIKEFYEGVVKSEPVLHSIDELRTFTKEKIEGLSEDLSSGKKEEVGKIQIDIISHLDVIEKQYIETHDILIKSAGAGLNLSVVIHEIEKRIRELEKVVKTLGENELNIENLTKTKGLVESISKLIGNYASLVSNKQKKSTSLARVVEDAIFNTSFRFDAHKTEIIKKFKERKDIKIVCAANVIVGALLNIFDNSLYWLNSYGVDKKRIYVDFVDYENEIGILIADNGKGFTIAPEDAIRPFISMKTPPGSGTGLGLHIVDQTMRIHKGKFLIRDFKEINIPKEFSKGAIIELIFKKKNESK
ncbi:MAG: sensor histidine kinase [Candidatus Pacebacteria bacterium]|nr:sensor histidine kinase [Candidatus Paceibacterota bacterium]